MIQIQNEKLTAQINEFGAELTSVKSADGREYIWNGDPKYWEGHSPILFPICGRLVNKQYTYGSKVYKMGTHGFARDKMFSAEKVSDSEAVFTLCDDEETLAQYPFRFVFRARFKLDGDSLFVTYETENKDEKEMYFNVGAHEAFAAGGNFEDWSVEFEKTEDLKLKDQPVLGYLNGKVIPFRANTKELPLKHSLFEADALIFDSLKSRSVTLKHCGKPVAKMNFEGFDYFLLWTKVGAPYICLEPWNGLPDDVACDGELTHRPGMVVLKSGKSFSLTHSIRFF